MTWTAKPTLKLAAFLAFLMVDDHLASPLVNNICSQTKVIPQVRYMVSGDLDVSWPNKTGALIYSAEICCEKPGEGFLARCSNVCPSFKKMQACTYDSRRAKNICSKLVYQYITYSVRLNVQFQNCQARSDVVKITPEITIAHPSPVRQLVVTQPNDTSLVILWKKPKDASLDFCHSVTCYEINGLAKGKKVFQTQGKGQRVYAPLSKTSSTGTSYKCCVKLRLCSSMPKPFSEEICRLSRRTQSTNGSPVGH